MTSFVHTTAQTIESLANRFGLRTLQEWLRSPASFDRTVHYFEARSLLAGVRLVIGTSIFLAATLPTVMLFSEHGPASPAERWTTIAMITVALGWALRWWFGPMPSAQTSVAFVLTGDVGIAVASFAVPNRLLGMMGLSAMFLIALYIAFFHSLRMLEIHAVLVVIAYFPYGIWIYEEYGGAVAIATGVANPLLVVFFPVAIQIGVWTLSEDATVSGFDALTGLPNRRGFNLRAQLIVEDARKHRGEGLTLAVMLADLDHFKRINDTSGHLVGDIVLREVSKRIEKAAGITSTVGRIGGEEFAVVVLAPDSHVVAAAEQIRQSVAAISGIEGLQHEVSISIGVAPRSTVDLAPDDHPIPKLLAHADRALYEAKAAGRNRIAVATPA